MTETEHTLHDAHFQKQLVAFMLRDSGFLRAVAADLVAEYFSNEYMQRVVRLILQFYADNKAAPDTLIFHEIDKLVEAGHLKEDVARIMSKLVDDLYEYELVNKEYMLKEVSTFIQFQRIETGFTRLADLSRKYRFDEAAKLAKEMYFSAPLKDASGRFYSADARDRVIRRQHESPLRCWTLIPEVDAWIEGLMPGEIGVWQSQQSSMGKTAALVMLARNFVAQGKRVCLYSLEESVATFEDRLDQCLAGITREDLVDQFLIERRIARYLEKGDIWIEKFPDATTRISDLRDHTQMLRATKNFYPDVILIDYCDKVAPETAALRGNLFETGKEVYTHWRQWMGDEGLVGWTGMQSNRSAGAADENAGQQHTGGSIAKQHIADVVLSINKNKEDTKRSTLTISIVKNRKGVTNRDFRITTDFATMAFRIFPEAVL